MISWYIDSSCIKPPATQDGSVLFRSTRSSQSEELLRLPDTVGQRVYLIAGVVQVKAGPCARLNAHRAVQGPRTVMAGADRDATVVEYLADVVRMHAVQREGDSTPTVDRRRRADDPQPVNLG